MLNVTKSLSFVVSCALAVVLAGTPEDALAAIRHVNASRPDDSGDGLSWAAAEKTLQAALASAIGGDEIWVAAGTYKPDQGGGQTPGNRSATFQLKGGVAIYGGFAGTETMLSQRDTAANPTILSGDLAGDDLLLFCVMDGECLPFGGNCLDNFCNIADNNHENSYHVVRSNGVSGALDGFTITSGNANGSFPDNQGGGLYITGSTPTISNCTFARNSAGSNGGGAHHSSGGGTFRRCTFNGNSAGNGGGGGLYNSGSGGEVVRCTFRGNVGKGIGGGAGGGLYNVNSSDVDVVNCVFLGNDASTGGGMSITNNSTGTVVNCLFSGNTALSAGGLEIGVGSTPTLSNCAFSGNMAAQTGDGGGIRNSDSNPFIFNSIFWANSDSGGMDSTAQIHVSSGLPSVNYNIIQGGWVGGSGNLSADPLFVDADGPDDVFGTLDDNVRILPGSPAIDSGHTGALPSDSTDLDGNGITKGKTPLDLDDNPRQADDPFVADTGQPPTPIVDMGPYERAVHVIYVDASATGAGNGSDWANAFVHLQSALSLAGDTPTVNEIWVADGTYMPDGGRTPVGGAHINGSGDRTATFQLLNNVALLGGFAGGETSLDQRDPALHEAILSGDLLGNDLPVACTQDSPDCDGIGPGSGIPCLDGFCIIAGSNPENSYNVVKGSGTNATAAIDGFTIIAGNANGPVPANSGAGMYNDNGSPTVNRCTFRGNSATNGGAMFNTASSPMITDCALKKNAGISGGGMLNTLGSAPAIRSCMFDGNSSNSQGGGIANFNGSSAVIALCNFLRNSADNNGGGITNASSNASVAACTFTGNSGMLGGAMFNQSDSDAFVTNCLFHGNSADFGGAMGNLDATTTPIVTNCTFSGNSAAFDGGGVYNFNGGSPTFRNCILWGNSDQGGMDSSAQIHTQSGNPGVFFSTVQGGWSGAGLSNLSSDPMFFDPDGADAIAGTIDDNLRLRAGSPAIDSGNTLFVPADSGDLDGDGNTGEQTPLDLDGQPRVVAMTDQGAYEYFTDCNHNGVPDATDIALGTSQDCGSGGKYWPENGIPDECDVATCPKPGPCVGGPNDGAPCTVASDCPSGDCAGEEFLGCQDCNLNGAPDACDIFNGSSFDADENGIPDECGYFTGDCIEPMPAQRYWTCPENWLLNGQYPDDEDSAAGISVNLPEGAVVILDEYVAIPNLYIHSGAELQMITPDTGIDVDQAIQVDGTLTMESCRLAGNTPPVLTIRAGGKFQTGPCTSAGDPSTMVAAEIRVEGSDCFIPPCPDGGSVDLDESISFTSTGDLVIDGTLANGPCEPPPLRDADGHRLSYHTPPLYSSRGSSSTTVEGTVYMFGAPHMNIETSVPWELGGNFENLSVRPDCFHWPGGLNLNGTAQEFEVAASDVGSVTIGGQVAGATPAEFAMGSVIIRTGSSVTFRDNFDNNLSGQAPCTEAAYVGALTLEAGAAMTIQDCRVYYASLSVDPTAMITLAGCAELLGTPIAPPPSVEPDPSGINKSRFISFTVPQSQGSSESALRITLDSLHHVVPPYTGGPSAPFTSFEGQVRWVGPPVQYVESTSNPTPFFASSLQCTPHYQDWSTVGLLHVTGSAIVPSSNYEVDNVAAACMGNEAACTAVSAPLSLATTRWADVVAPFNPPDASEQPNFTDVNALVDKFRSAPTAPIKARTLLAGSDAFGNLNIAPDLGFNHIAVCVDAFRGLPYPYAISTCP